MDGRNEVTSCFVDFFFVRNLAHGHDIVNPSSVFIMCPYIGDRLVDCFCLLGCETGEAKEEGRGVGAVEVVRFKGDVSGRPDALGEDEVGGLF